MKQDQVKSGYSPEGRFWIVTYLFGYPTYRELRNLADRLLRSWTVNFLFVQNTTVGFNSSEW